MMRVSMPDTVPDRVDFGLVRYASCWEDADVLCAALAPKPGKRFLSIASGGDNSLALLAEGAHVVAADVSAAQLACLELRCAAYRRLTHADMLAFLGLRPCPDRGACYRELAADLSPGARAFWDLRARDIADGFVHAGRFERYFRLFRTWVLPWIHSAATVRELLAPRDEPARARFYEERWNTWRWRLLFRCFFGRFAMGRLGRDPEFFKYVQGSVADRLLARTRHALTALPTHTNPYLHAVLTGTFGATLPRALRAEHFAAIRAGLDRLTLFHGRIEAAARTHGAGGFDGYNLSDIFEYLAAPACEAVYRAMLDVARPQARFAYWNMLVPRRVPETLAARVNALTPLAQELFARDQAWFYSALVVEEVAA